MVKKDLSELSDEDVYEAAKNYLLHAKQVFSNLEQTDPSLRCTFGLKNEDLKALQMSIVMNSLAITKVKMQPEGLRAKIDFEKSVHNLPII